MKKNVTIFTFVLFFAFVFSVSGDEIKEAGDDLSNNHTSQCFWEEDTVLDPSDGSHADYFGRAVDMEEDAAVIGAPNHNSNLGAVYVFEKENGEWIENQKLEVSDLYGKWDAPEFGNDISLSGERVAVGAYNHDGDGINQGAVYVFKKIGETWEMEEVIIAPDPADQKHFGSSVKIEGDKLAVGALGYDDSGGDYSGSVYIFEFKDDEWIEKQKIVPPNPAPFNYFGDGLDLEGNQLVILSRLNNMFAEDGGAVFYFKNDGEEWVLEQSFSASDLEEGDQFGWSVSMSGAVLAVGTIMSDVCGSFSGNIYVFEKEDGEWIEEEKLTNSDCQSVSLFGGNVSIVGESILAGASSLDVGNFNNSGAVYLFSKDEGVWSESEVFYEPDPGNHHNFGSSLASFGGSFIAGAQFSGSGGGNPGRAYLYSKNCQENPICLTDLYYNNSIKTSDNNIPTLCRMLES